LGSGTCPLCRQRKGKRPCPAKGALICSTCCGTKRRVEIDCPADCVYLTGAHAGAWGGRETERRRDALRVAPFIQRLSQRQAQIFFLTLAGVNGLRARRPEMDDRLLAEAVHALLKTVETRDRGILYEHVPEDQRAHTLLGELQALYEAKDAEGRPTRPDDRDLLPALRALDTALGETLKENAAATVFLDSIGRLVGRPEAAKPASRLIVEP
jgi:hypothetical protein